MTLGDIKDGLELQKNKSEEKTAHLHHRVECLEQDINRCRTEANLVVSGLSEAEDPDHEETTEVVFDIVRSTLGVNQIKDGDTLEARRLGRLDRAKPRSRRRRVLVRTLSKSVRDKIMSAKFN